MKLINWLIRQLNYIKFRIHYPDVCIVRPLTMGTFFSQDGQDLYISSLIFKELKDSDGAVVVDVGCNHPEHFSNSYFFEKYFFCKTIAVDPIEEYAELWRSMRPNAIFIATALGKAEGTVTLNIPEKSEVYDDMFSSVVGKNPKIGKTSCVQRKVPCVTLASILKSNGIENVMLLSIDVEGAELEVLEGIDFDSVLIKCLVIENNTKNIYGSEDIRIFLLSKGFVFFSRIGYLDDVFLHKTLLDKVI